METIKNYLEAMFANLPNTPQVLRAKDELWQMMEDKYTELRENGRTENEAVGTVISEFGNLDEISDILGIKDDVNENPFKEVTKKMISLDEVKVFLKDNSLKAVWVGLAVMLCIISVTFPMITDDLNISPVLNFGMFGCIAIAVGLFVFVGLSMKKWNYIKKGDCAINYETAQYLINEEARQQSTTIMARVFGIVLCSMCWLPAAVINAAHLSLKGFASGGVFLFLMVGLGVFLLIYSGVQIKAIKRLKKLNSEDTVAGSYGAKKVEPEYISPAAKTICTIFWPVIVCLYLAISFLTFKWEYTWIIWPVAAIVGTILNTTLKVNK